MKLAVPGLALFLSEMREILGLALDQEILRLKDRDRLPIGIDSIGSHFKDLVISPSIESCELSELIV
jgi:hypothetical protein